MKAKTNKPKRYFNLEGEETTKEERDAQLEAFLKFEEWKFDMEFKQAMDQAFHIHVVYGQEEAEKFMNQKRKEWQPTQDNTHEK